MDKYLTRTYDRKPMKVKKNKQKKMKQSTLHACKKVVVLENLAELNVELDGIAKLLLNKTSIKTTNEKHNKHIKTVIQKKDEEPTSSCSTTTANDRTNQVEGDDEKAKLVKRACNILDELNAAFISLETLEKTGVGLTVNLFAKKKIKHPYTILREKSSNLVKKWKAKVEEGCDRRKRHKKVRMPVVSSSTSSYYGNSNNNYAYSSSSNDKSRSSVNKRNNNNTNNYRYRNSLSTLDFTSYKSSKAQKTFLENNHKINNKKRNHHDDYHRFQNNEITRKKTKRNLTYEQVERIKRNKEIAVNKLMARKKHQH